LEIRCIEIRPDGLSEFIGKPISLAAEPAMNPDQYDIVLM
jgi:ribonuclease G